MNILAYKWSSIGVYDCATEFSQLTYIKFQLLHVFQFVDMCVCMCSLKEVSFSHCFHIQMVKNQSSAGKESTCNVGDLGSIPVLARTAGEGIGYPLQYYGLENSGYRVRGVTKSRTILSKLHFHFSRKQWYFQY